MLNTQTTDNILVCRKHDGSVVLRPIDHGYSMPDYRDMFEVRLCWARWPQAKQAFAPDSLRFIRNLSPVDDARLLRQLGVRDVEILSCACSTRLLQLCAEKGFTLAQIADLVQRDMMDLDRLSALEILTREAVVRAQALVGRQRWEDEDMLRQVLMCFENLVTRAFNQAVQDKGIAILLLEVPSSVFPEC